MPVNFCAHLGILVQKNAETRLPLFYKPLFMRSVGLWRSLVARPSGGRKAAGSNPASPTNFARFVIVLRQDRA